MATSLDLSWTSRVSDRVKQKLSGPLARAVLEALKTIKNEEESGGPG